MAVDLRVMSKKYTVLDTSQLQVSTTTMSANTPLASATPQRDPASVLPQNEKASGLLEFSAIPTHVRDDDSYKAGGNLLLEEHTQRYPCSGCCRVFQIARPPGTGTVSDETCRLANLTIAEASSVKIFALKLRQPKHELRGSKAVRHAAPERSTPSEGPRIAREIDTNAIR